MTHLFNPDDTAQVAEAGRKMHQMIAELYPICRSITGNGVRQTLQILGKHIPLDVREVPSGTAVFDWTIPKEWNINAAHIKTAAGRKIVDFNDSNLHVLNYSNPIHKTVSLSELKEHLFTMPEHPDWIPYRTSYYSENWGFCLSHNQYLELKDEMYEVYIDSSLEPGHLTYGEYLIEGETEDEVLISCHICHPSLCNDNLSSIAIAVFLADHLRHLPLKRSYRFLFIPGTIGSITWLSQNEARAPKITHGLVLACLGDSGRFSYKKSRQAASEMDRAVLNILQQSEAAFNTIEFFPFGYDERQYCSPGFDLPVGCLMRTPHGQYPEYHTSADNLELVRSEYLAASYLKCLAILEVVEHNATYVNLNPKCEPQLGKRGLYQKLGGQSGGREKELAMLWILNLSDGKHSLLDISERSGVAFGLIKETADLLLQHDLLKNVSPES